MASCRFCSSARMQPRTLLLAALCAFLGAQLAAAMCATEVSTALQLKAAIDDGVEHIHITEHLDLRGLKPHRTAVLHDVADTLFTLPATLRSVTVRA